MPTHRRHPSSVYAQLSWSGGISTEGQGRIAIVTTSPERVHSFTRLIKNTAYAAHQVIWIPANSSLQDTLLDRGAFDVALIDVENSANARATHAITQGVRRIPIQGSLFSAPRLEKQLRRARIPTAIAAHPSVASLGLLAA